MAYYYETHLHTCQGSACGASTGAEHARRYKELGYQGVIVTDHFFGGNTAVPRTLLSWEERIELFCQGYEDAKAEGDRIGLDVFFGLEQNFRGDEYLIYGLDKAYLMAHPEMEHWTRREMLEEVHKGGGCVIQAHPFRNRDYIQKILLCRQFCDGIEAANAGNYLHNDAAAYRYAREFGLPMTAGSDNHSVEWTRKHEDVIMGVALDQPLTCIQDYVQLILHHGPIGLKVPQGRFDLDPDYPDLETYWLDEDEQPYPTHRSWLKD